MAGKLIRVFFLDGEDDGIKTLEISNRTIFCTVFSRPLFDKFKNRPENNKPGVYILVGQGDDGIKNKIYVGEGDPVGFRLYSHNANKDFWTEAVVLTSKDQYLSKTQIQYIESKFIKLGFDSKNVAMDNGNSPNLPNISEAEEAEVTDFIENAELLIKAAGYYFFEPIVTKDEPTDNDVVFELINNKHMICAKMMIKKGKYVLLKGSLVVKNVSAAASNWIKNNRKYLEDNELLIENDANTLKLAENTEFDSPSGAGSVVVGYNVNGFQVWKNNGKTLAEYEQEKNK